MSGVRVHELVKTYRRGSVRALDGISLDVAPGEAVGIIGPNGAGKTTLMGCLLGFLLPDRGAVTLDGLPPDSLAARAATGYLPERPALDRWRTGLDVLRFHHALAGLDPAHRDEDAAAALARVGLSPEAGKRRVARYSQGMLQRLGLAQAMLGRPRYLFLDEPTTGLDPGGVMLFRRLLVELRNEGATLLLNSHHLDQVERICTRVVFVRRGKIEATVTPDGGTNPEASRLERLFREDGTP
jgi:ABC-type multidrug transport system ATPase subunit